MITNNYINAVKNQYIDAINAPSSVDRYPTYNVNGTDVSSRSNFNSEWFQGAKFFKFYSTIRSNSFEGDNGCVIFGTGTTPPTPDDVAMSGEIINNSYLGVSTNTSVTKIDGKLSMAIGYTITNKNTDDITISEVGSFANNLLLDHTLLDTPITIPPTGVGQVTYTITFDLE